jgi:hypothetical protein
MAKKINPWAICHSQLGKKKTDKFERCVMKIKSKHGIKDWTEFKEALRYLSETVQGQADDIRVARERQEKEAARKAAAPKPLRKGDKSKMGESVSFKEKLKYMKEQYNPEHLKGKAGQVKKPDPDMPALQKAMQRFHRADRAARGVNPQPHGAPKPKKPETSGDYEERMKKAAKEAVRSGELQRRGNWPGKVRQVGRKDDGTEHEGPSLREKIAHLVEKKKKDWIQGAVDPAHKGFCTPMTKKTCTPARKALAKRFKKAGRREGTKAGGKTGWKGKV